MNEDFFIYLNFKDRKHVKFRVNDPNTSLQSLMESFMKSNVFDMPTHDYCGCPISYYFGKVDDDGRPILLCPEVKGVEKSLVDYNVKSKDELCIVPCPIA